MADSIVDEMARAIAAHDGETRPVDRTTEARAAAAARRLREIGLCAPTDEPCRVCRLLAELEGGT